MRSRLLLVVITSTRRPPGTRLKMQKCLKLSLKRVKVQKKVDPYACGICAKEEYFKRWKRVGHISREISRQVYYFIKIEGGFVNWTVISTDFLPSLKPPGGLEIPLLFKFLCYKEATFEEIKTFAQTLYDYNFVGTVTKDSSAKKDEMTIGIVSDSHSDGDQQLVG